MHSHKDSVNLWAILRLGWLLEVVPSWGREAAPSLFGYHQSLVQPQLWASGFFSADGTFWSWLSAAALQVAQEISAPSRKGLQRQ